MSSLQTIYLGLLAIVVKASAVLSRHGAARGASRNGSLLLLMSSLPKLLARPIWAQEDEDLPKTPDDPSLWLYLSVAAILVLLGGAFAGLTIALMGQDEIYLQVIASSGDGKERRHAARVLRLLQRGKHWVLVTLLLGNVITNETLPIVLDRSLGGGWPAVLGSTVLIVIFGEIIPQSVCVRYGLPIGAYLAPLVLVLMYILAPVAWPTARLLDYLLGQDHGTTYKKAGLKTLVTLHKTLGPDPGDRLNQDEVTIISAVLDLKDKPVGSIMTPMDDVFTMSSDAVLDDDTVDGILSAGYSRIPIHAPGDSQNFVGMLLVKMLITYDPEDCMKVSDFALATLPETAPDTSCLDIVNFFQEGKSHMVLVSQYPGENFGSLGVVTLEDVIEELIGEEIIDESDVYIDVHKAIRRLQPAPKARIRGIASRQASIVDSESEAILSQAEESDADTAKAENGLAKVRTGSASEGKGLNRLKSKNSMEGVLLSQSMRQKMTPEVREHLKHLGPSNLASKPKTTKYSTVKIKPGAPADALPVVSENADSKIGTVEEGDIDIPSGQPQQQDTKTDTHIESKTDGKVKKPPPDESALPAEGDSLRSSLASAAKKGYGTLGSAVSKLSETVTPSKDSGESNSKDSLALKKSSESESHRVRSPGRPDSAASSRQSITGLARSGSLVESEIHVGGVRKVVVNVSSSSSDNESQQKSAAETSAAGGSKKKRRKRRKNHKGKDSKEGDGEQSSLLPK